MSEAWAEGRAVSKAKPRVYPRPQERSGQRAWICLEKGRRGEGGRRRKEGRGDGEGRGKFKCVVGRSVRGKKLSRFKTKKGGVSRRELAQLVCLSG